MRKRPIALAAATLIVLAACSSDDNEPGASNSSVEGDGDLGTSSPEDAADLAVEAGAPFPDERCAANEAAGTVTFLTGFDYAAASSIVDVIVADAAGYYDELCLDVEIVASNSTANYPLIASGNAQFASGGSFSEIIEFGLANDADFVATTIEGHDPIDALMIKAGEATELADLEGSTIGVKGKLPPSIDVMLRGAGLTEGEDYDTVALTGYDPIAHFAIDEIAGLPGWKSNEVGTLERAGAGLQLFDPVDYDVPGSFGAIFTSASFVEDNPTAAEDFVRATVRGLADAVADPAAAAETAVALIVDNGNPSFLSPEGETFRWETETRLIADATPEGTGLGVPDPVALQVEVDAYADVGLFGEGQTPDATDYLAEGLAAGVYDDAGMVIWPG